MSVRASIPTLPARILHPAINPTDYPISARSNPIGRAMFRLPVWVQLTILYVLSRIVTTVFMLWFANKQPDSWQISAQPDYFSFANIWDAAWYQRIATYGYPGTLPVNEWGAVTENAWAFMPVYPFLVRGVSVVTMLPFEVASVLVSLVAGLATTFAFHRLMRYFLGPRAALVAVGLVLFGPISPLFQVGYAEALHFWMLCQLLIELRERRWLQMMPLIAVASLTRPTGLAWAFTMLLVILNRYYSQHVRRIERFDRQEQLHAWIAAVVSGVMGLAWLILCGIVTGRPLGYLDTEHAWRNHYTGGADTPPFTPWFHAGKFWLDQPHGTLIVAVMILGVTAIIVGLGAPIMQRFGAEITAWGIAYFSYILAVFFPQSSTFRMLFPMFPAAAGPMALPQSPLYRVLVFAGAIVAQLLWLRFMWFVEPGDWSAP